MNFLQNKLFQAVLPHGVSVLLFIVVNAIFFAPQFEGKMIGQDDINESPGKSKEIAEYREVNDRTPLWTGSQYIGQPSFYTGLSFQNPLAKLERVLYLGFGRPANVFILSMLTTYIALLVFGVNPWISMIGGLGYGMATNNIILFHAGHMMKIGSLLYLPIIFAGAYLLVNRRYLGGFVLYALGFAMTVYQHHIQMIYYGYLCLLIFGFWYLIEWIKTKDYKRLGTVVLLVILGSGLGITSNLARMWTTYEISDESIRGANILEPVDATGQASETEPEEGLDWEYAMAWSNNSLDLLAGLVPGIVGGSSGERMKEGAAYNALRRSGAAMQPDQSYRLPMYWGALPFTSGPVYFGAVMLLLFAMGAGLARGGLKWFLVGGTILTFAISYGKNLEFFNRILFDYFPLYSKFRTPQSVTSVTSMLIPMLGAIGLWEWKKHVESAKKIHWQPLLIGVGVIGGLCLFVLLAGPSMFSFQGANDSAYAQSGLLPLLIEDRKAMLTSDALRSLVFVFLTGTILALYAMKRVKFWMVVIGLAGLVIMDFWGVNRRYIAPDDFQKSQSQIAEDYYAEREIDQYIKSLEGDRGDYRVLDLSINTFNTNKTTYHHNTIGGYTAVKLQRIQDMIDVHLATMNRDVLNMMNTSYIITQNEQVIDNEDALGWAWLVEDWVFVETNRDEINTVAEIDPAKTAVVKKDEFGAYMEGLSQITEGNGDELLSNDSSDSDQIERVDYQLDYWKYEYDVSQPRLAVFSEIWYKPTKGLHAYVNGERAEFIRVNYMLRGIKVPEGEGIIEFRFEPASYIVGNPVTQASGWGLIVMLVGWIAYTLYGTYQARD